MVDPITRRVLAGKFQVTHRGAWSELGPSNCVKFGACCCVFCKMHACGVAEVTKFSLQSMRLPGATHRLCSLVHIFVNKHPHVAYFAAEKHPERITWHRRFRYNSCDWLLGTFVHHPQLVARCVYESSLVFIVRPSDGHISVVAAHVGSL